jgi:pimeloyl-ACP methyl ester carboxylesterase
MRRMERMLEQLQDQLPKPLRIDSRANSHTHCSLELHTTWDVVGPVRVRGRVNDRALVRDGAAPHAVFVHGLGMATNYLEPTMRAIGNDIAVSALDLPGFGGSRPVRGHLSLAALADALVAWIRAREIVAPILVGQSHGCQVVVEAVARTPDVASALVLNAPTMLAGHRSIGAQLWRVALDTPREPLALVPHVARDYLRAGPVRILRTLNDALRDRIEDKLLDVRVPVTIVNGARDPVSPPAWGERLARLTGSRVGGAGAHLVVVPGAAHAVPFSHPNSLVAEILAMAGRVESRTLR